MYIHPLEALGYYFILWSPPFAGHALRAANAALRSLLCDVSRTVGAADAGAAWWCSATSDSASSEVAAAAPVSFSFEAPHVTAFLIYVAVVGLAGILDHSGEEMIIRKHYNYN